MSTIDTIEYCSSLEKAWSLHLLQNKNHAMYPGQILEFWSMRLVTTSLQAREACDDNLTSLVTFDRP